jgi:hypothetical protein
MRRLATLLAALLLALPATAFAQGAGDDQYQDPFGDEPAQSDSGGGSDSDGGLSDDPPSTGGGGDDSGSSDSGSSGGGSDTAPSTGTAETPAATAEATGDALPRTGAEPLLFAGIGIAFLLTGLGLRLRTIDPDAY